MDAKSSLISQISFYSNIHVFFQWNLYQFGDSFWHEQALTPPQLMECVTVMLTRDVYSCGYVGSST